MRLRLGLTVGLAAGYYLGSKAGRPRYEQINRAIRQMKRSDAYEGAAEKAREVVDTGVARAMEVVGGGRSNGNGSTPIVP